MAMILSFRLGHVFLFMRINLNHASTTRIARILVLDPESASKVFATWHATPLMIVTLAWGKLVTPLTSLKDVEVT
jgi:hypothetical protein